MANKTQVSICIEDLFAASKAKHPAIKEGKNGKHYASVDIWEQDTPDKFGNDFSVSLYDKDAKKATYIGNGKKYAPKQSAASGNDPFAPTSDEDKGDSDLPF